MTQLYARTIFAGGGESVRIVSTFSFFTQNFGFTMSMVTVGYALWRMEQNWTSRIRRAAAGLFLIAAMLAAILSGSHGPIQMLAALLGLIVVFDYVLASPNSPEQRRSAPLGSGVRAPVRRTRAVSAAAIASVFIAIVGIGSAIVGVSVTDLFGTGAELLLQHLQEGFLDPITWALNTTWLGYGTGIDSAARRFGSENIVALGGLWYESWWTKIVLELGVVGLVIVLALFATMIARSYRGHRSLREPTLKGVSAPLGFLLWTLIYGLKAQPIDFDPINVYFWLFAGVLARLPAIERASVRPLPLSVPSAASVRSWSHRLPRLAGLQ